MNPIARIGMLGKTYRHIKRYQEILSVIFKYGYGDILNKINIRNYFDFDRNLFEVKPEEKVHELNRWERVRMIIEELGPGFIKMGQILSVRPDIIPKELAWELEKLQDQVPPFPGEDAKSILEKELGGPVDRFFKNFEETPAASASIAQVHRAETLKGKRVAIKIQRPGIKNTIRVDTEILYHLAELAEKYLLDSHSFKPTKMVEEFTETLGKELDFHHEASNIARFARNFENRETIYVPQVYSELSTERILTMEYIDGIKIIDREKIKKAGMNAGLIAERCTDLVLEQIFIFGFFHADPHGGNIYVLRNNVICFLDYGMMGAISSSIREGLNDFIITLTLRDEQRLAGSVLKLSGVKSIPDRDGFEQDIVEFMQKYFYLPLKEIKMAKMFPDLIRLMDKNNVVINPQAYLLLKSFGTIEGTAMELYPDLEMMKRVEPFARTSMETGIDPDQFVQDFYWHSRNISRTLMELPDDIKDIVHRMKTGKINIDFEHRGLEPMLREWNIISSRIVFAIVLAAMIIGSSLVTLSNIPPLYHDVPLIGVIGYAISAIIGIWLLYSIIKGGNI